MTPPDLVLFLAGTFAGAFVSGLSGFAFGLVTLAIWVWLIPLPELTPLVLFGSLAAQLVAIPKVLPHADWHRLRPLLICAVVGVPIGVLLIPHVALDHFRIGFGALLIGFSLFQLVAASRWHVADSRRIGEMTAALAGGVLGGLAGLSGVVLVVWGVLRRWEMQPFRAVLTLFNTACHVVGLTTLLLAGALTSVTLLRCAIMVPFLALGAWLGVRAWRYVSPTGFRRLVLVLLLASGTTLILRGVLRAVAA